ncbi:MAG: 2-hydroxyacid dehydrogenase [Actinomycetes bacterium]
MHATTVVTLPAEDWLRDLQPLPGGIEARVWDVESPPAQALGADADRVGLVVWPYMSQPAAARSLGDLPALHTVQTLTAGYDDLLGVVPGGVRIANAAGVHEASTAELALGLAIASLRGIDDAVRNAQEGRWVHRHRPSLADRRVLVLGLGPVGSGIVERFAPFEVSLTRVASRPRDDAHGHVHGVDELPSLLPEHDVVVLATSLTDATRGLVDAAFLAAMPDGALLVNVSRGPVVRTDALLAELQRGRLRAALDVVDPEPLPPGHPLWTAPGVIITPHLGGDTSAMRPRAVALLRRQLGRLAAGEEPANIVVGGPA